MARIREQPARPPVGRTRSRSWQADAADADAAAPGARRRRRRLLPDPRARAPPRFERTDRETARRSAERPRRRRRAAGWSTSAGSPAGVPGEELSPHLRSRDEVGDAPARLRRADGRAARRGDHRLGVGVVRDAALPHRAAAGDGHAALGRHPHPADRHPGRAALPRRLRRRCRPTVNRGFDIGGPDVLTYREMMQRYAAVAGLPAAAHRAGAGADADAVEPLGRAGHAGAELHRPTAGRVAGARGRLRGARHRRLRARPAERGPDRLRPGGRLALQAVKDADVATRWSSASDAGRAERPAADRPRLGRRQPVRRRARRAVSTPPPRRCGG